MTTPRRISRREARDHLAAEADRAEATAEAFGMETCRYHAKAIRIVLHRPIHPSIDLALGLLFAVFAAANLAAGAWFYAAGMALIATLELIDWWERR